MNEKNSRGLWKTVYYLKEYPQTKCNSQIFLPVLPLRSGLSWQRRSVSNTLILFCVKTSRSTPAPSRTSPIRASVISKHIPLTAATLRSQFLALRCLRTPKVLSASKTQPEPRPRPTPISPPTPKSSSLRSLLSPHRSSPPPISGPVTGSTAPSALTTLSCRQVETASRLCLCRAGWPGSVPLCPKQMSRKPSVIC